MKLTRLRLIGFKSFVEPTDFLIEPGLTGVVGPNGCGKSNLVEALRWVMGETSHKSMRAAEMDDVIFAGNNNRPPRNTAEVAIQIDNEKHEAPTQFNEHDQLDISRRIEREKGSQYRINGREVRARDVMTLFADASTGSRSPALVHQGRIGEIIQAKPEQRRRVLEEAAGISGLHARRHEAELRLKAAESNLLRVEDVVNQLAGQIDGLKRQARQAIRYRNVSAEVRKVEATLYYLRWLGANAEVDESEQGQGPERPRGRRRHHRAERSRQGPRGSSRRRAAAPRGRGPAGCRAAAPADRPRHARRRGDPRPRTPRRARPAAGAVRRGRHPRTRAGRRRRSGAGAARAGRRNAAAGGPDQRRAAHRRRCPRGRGRCGRHRGRKDLRRTDRPAGRSHRAPQPADADRPRTGRAHRADGQRDRQYRGGPRGRERKPSGCRGARNRGRERAGRGRPGRAEHGRGRSRARRGAQASRSRPPPARRRRARGAAARHRSQDLDEAARGRDPEHVAAGDRQHHRREGLRDRAWRGARRRSRRAGRPEPRDALGRRHGRSVRSGAAGGRAVAGQARAGAGRACPPPRPDRRRRARRRRPPRGPAQARPAARLARRRPVALGRLCRRRPCADRRGAAPGATKPPRRHRRRTRHRAHRGRRKAQDRRSGAGRI